MKNFGRAGILAVAALGWLEPCSAAEPKRPLEWNLSLGGALGFAIPSFEDRWSLQVSEPPFEISVSESARYSPAKPLEAEAAVQAWLPFGLGLFVEYQRHVQDVPARIAADATLRGRPCPRCPLETFTVEGRLDSEKFERTESRVHLGAGYRVRLGTRAYAELSGGATRVSLKQDLVREIGSNEDCDFVTPRCTVELQIEQREAQKGSTWGFNVGAAAARFFTDHVGVAIHVRYSKGGKLQVRGLEAVEAQGQEFRNQVTLETESVAAGLSLRVRF